MVDSRPNENRTSEFAASASTPRAAITCDGSSEPAEQADPLEAQIPSRSSPASSEMLSQPPTVNATVLARQAVSGLLMPTPCFRKAQSNSVSLVVNGFRCSRL